MPGVGVLFFVAVGIAQSWAQQYLNNRPFPTYSLENMPETTFSCRDKILGGYYADPDTQCQMFHICVKVAGVGVQDFRFLCPNGTAFDQDHQICAEWEDVDCDASTLYYSSDNFDLYRIGSGLESKPAKYGEDEETFALQRAETGDARLNREHQSGSVNQKKEQKFNYQRPKPAHNANNNNNNDSSSNFFNNRNNGKERDEDYDDNVNANQDRDNEQKRKVVRNRGRKPSVQADNNRNEHNRNVQPNNRNTQNGQHRNVQNNDHNNAQNNDYNRNTQANNNYNNQNNNYNRNNQNADYNRNSQTTDFTRNTPAPPADFARTSPNQNTDYTRQSQTNNYNQNTATAAADNNEAQTRRPASRPTGFLNNFAGSSYIPTTLRPSASSTTINNEQYTTAINNYRARNGQKPRPQQTNDYTAQTPQYTVSTPAPFKQTQFRQSSTFAPTKDTENYPKVKLSTTERYDQQSKFKQSTSGSSDYSAYEVTKTKPSTHFPGTKTENYPSNNPQYFDKKPTTPLKQTEAFSTTLSTKPKPFSQTQTLPTTFAPRTNAAYTQIAQQTLKQSSTLISTGFVQAKSSTASKAPVPAVSSTPYTPTVPKISPTTPIARSSRFDETQYDDGSYDSAKYDNAKYDYDGDRRDDEFLKGAHSQNIAASRNEFAQSTNTISRRPRSTTSNSNNSLPRGLTMTAQDRSRSRLTRLRPPITMHPFPSRPFKMRLFLNRPPIKVRHLKRLS
nr:unnamed protein product [Callosobruchus chinensis]